MSKSFKRLPIIVAFSVLLGACTTVSNWFKDEEEIEIRTLPELTNAFEPEIVWQEGIGDGVENFYSQLTPAIAYGKVFASDREGNVMAFDPETGEDLWETVISRKSREKKLTNLYGLFPATISAKVSGGIIAAYELVYFGTEDGDVYALNQEDGSIKWQTRLKSEVVSSPAVDAGILVVNTVSGLLVGLDAYTGEIKWQNESDVPPLSLRGVSSPAAAAGGAIVGLANGRLRVSILESGLTAWEQIIAKPTGATELERIVDVDATPLVFGPNVYIVSYGGALASVELRTGSVVWNRDYASYKSVTIDGNRLFVTDNNSNVYAIDRRNGVELWSNGQLRRRDLTAATPVGDYVVAGDKFGYLHFFTQDEGKYVARIEVGDDDEDEALYHAPVFQDGVLIVQTRDGELTRVSIPQ